MKNDCRSVKQLGDSGKESFEKTNKWGWKATMFGRSTKCFSVSTMQSNRKFLNAFEFKRTPTHRCCCCKLLNHDKHCNGKLLKRSKSVKIGRTNKHKVVYIIWTIWYMNYIIYKLYIYIYIKHSKLDNRLQGKKSLVLQVQQLKNQKYFFQIYNTETVVRNKMCRCRVRVRNACRGKNSRYAKRCTKSCK